MSPEELHQTQALIDSLTTDEDVKQELWILFLSGHPPSSLKSNLDTILWENYITERVSTTAFEIMHSYGTLSGLLDFLSPLERTIVILVASGITLDIISRYKGISHIRLRQILFSIQRAPSWMLLAKGSKDVKEETERRRKNRTDRRRDKIGRKVPQEE